MKQVTHLESLDELLAAANRNRVAGDTTPMLPADHVLRVKTGLTSFLSGSLQVDGFQCELDPGDLMRLFARLARDAGLNMEFRQ